MEILIGLSAFVSLIIFTGLFDNTRNYTYAEICDPSIGCGQSYPKKGEPCRAAKEYRN